MKRIIVLALVSVMIICTLPTKSIDATMEEYDYIIITTNELVEAITSSTFIDWKTSIGFNIKIVSVSDDEICGQSGKDLQEKVRNFLINYHQIWNIKYVLLIADNNALPMRICYPDPNNHEYNPLYFLSGDEPTDLYYADLSLPDDESWDLDGDGFYGEYGEDAPDLQPDVYVGRIPTNIPARVTYTLEKIVRFEQDTGDWKKNVLHASSFFYFEDQFIENGMGNSEIDGARVWDKVRIDLMSDYHVTSLTEQEGIDHSSFPGEPVSEDRFTSEWKNGRYGIVNWGGHGNHLGVSRLVWTQDDGDDIPEPEELSYPPLITVQSDLDDDYPSIVCASSCHVGFLDTELVGNRLIGADLLTKPNFGAAVGVISNTRVMYVVEDWPEEEGLLESLFYHFYRYLLIEKQPLGDSLLNAKYYCNQVIPYYDGQEGSSVEYVTHFILNLYGDPSLVYEGIAMEGKPEKPTLNGVSNGKIGEEYTFQAVSHDPEGSDVFYFFDWGDGSNSGWLGPYTSGTVVDASYTWEEKGSYEIKVQAKDSSGLVSEWSDPLAFSIAKYKGGWFVFSLFERLNTMLSLLGISFDSW